MRGKHLAVVSLLVLSSFLVFFQSFLNPFHLIVSPSSTKTRRIRQGCYFKQAVLPTKWATLNRQQLKTEHCEKRRPDCLIIGAKKCGTTALRDFLGFHPGVAVVQTETHYFTSKYYRGLNWYLDQMPYSKVDQVTVEKTPRYLVYPGAAERAYKHLGTNIKLIIVICDPIERAISDFVHIHTKASQAKKDAPAMNLTAAERRLREQNKEALRDAKPAVYNLSLETFKESVLDSSGNIRDNDALTDTGVYIKYINKWLSFYPRSQLLALDGEEVVTNPVASLQKVETFLGLPPYFNERHVYFDPDKGFYCLAYPVRDCMGASKGRPHPNISHSLRKQLEEFYRPFNHQLANVLDQTFAWVD